MMVETLSLCLCCSRCFAALVLCSAHLHIACMQLLHLAVLPSRSIACLLMRQTERASPLLPHASSLVLPDTCLDDTPHTFLGAVNNDKNCLLSHSFPTKALSQSFTLSPSHLLLSRAVCKVNVVSFLPPLLHIVALSLSYCTFRQLHVSTLYIESDVRRRRHCRFSYNDSSAASPGLR